MVMAEVSRNARAFRYIDALMGLCASHTSKTGNA